MTYTISKSIQFNSLEISFTGKPSEAVRTALKALKFRWHGVKKIWYGFADESTVVDAIQKAEPDTATVYTDGYLCGGAVYGSKSNKAIYGTELAAAIRADIKAAGIKGVTISSRRGNITAKIKLLPGMLLSPEEYREIFDITKGRGFYWDGRNWESLDKYYSMDADQQADTRLMAADADLARAAAGEGLNNYYLDQYSYFSAEGLAKIKAIDQIIKNYRYDESNAMVDYFNTNFYYDLYTIAA